MNKASSRAPAKKMTTMATIDPSTRLDDVVRITKGNAKRSRALGANARPATSMEKAAAAAPEVSPVEEPRPAPHPQAKTDTADEKLGGRRSVERIEAKSSQSKDTFEDRLVRKATGNSGGADDVISSGSATGGSTPTPIHVCLAPTSQGGDVSSFTIDSSSPMSDVAQRTKAAMKNRINRRRQQPSGSTSTNNGSATNVSFSGEVSPSSFFSPSSGSSSNDAYVPRPGAVHIAEAAYLRQDGAITMSTTHEDIETVTGGTRHDVAEDGSSDAFRTIDAHVEQHPHGRGRGSSRRREPGEQWVDNGDKSGEREDKNRNRCVKRAAVALGVLCIVGLAVGLSIALTGGGGEADDNAAGESAEGSTGETSTTTSTTVPQPSLFDLCQTTDDFLSEPFFQLRDTLVADGISLMGDFDLLVQESEGEVEGDSVYASTPQRKALCWLTYVDALSFSSNNDSLLAQRYALAVLHYSLDVILPVTSECTWDHVGCNENGVVTSIDLSSKNLEGTIPEEIGRGLTMLEVLWLDNNRIHGKLPASFKNLSEMRSLTVWFNQLSGTVFDAMASMTKLEEANLSNNQFSDTSIPIEIGSLTNLRHLEVANNDLEGSLVSELGMLESLETFDASDNKLSGLLPPELGNLDALIGFHVKNNRLDGTISEALGNLKNLEELQLQENEFVGSVPSSVCALRTEGSLSILRVDCRYGEVVCDCCYNPTNFLDDPDNECF